MKSVFILGISTYMSGLFCVTGTQTLNYSFEEYKCKGDIRIDEHTEFFISYNGGVIDSLCYFMNFLGRDSKNLKAYQICMETIRYHDPDCAILVGLTSSSKFARDFNCTHNPPTPICYDNSLKIHIEPISVEKSSRNSSFLFKVMAHLTADKMELIWTILAASGSGLVLIIILIVSVRQIKSRYQNTKKKEAYETECEIYENSNFGHE